MSLPEVLTAIQDTLKESQCTATVFAHVGHGQLHLRPFWTLGTLDARGYDLSLKIAEVVWEYGGEVSVEHAAGLSRSYLLAWQLGELWQAMGQVKRLFDPQHA